MCMCVYVCVCVCVCAVFLDLLKTNAQITATSYKNLDKVPKTYTFIQLSSYIKYQ